jgi:hypothetical protein
MNNLNILALVYKYLSREFLPVVNQNIITIMKVYREQNRFVTKKIAEFNVNTLAFSVYADKTFSKDDYSKIYRAMMRLKRALSPRK